MAHHIKMPHDHGDIKNVLEALPDRQTCDIMASAFKQLGDATRLQIFWLLCHSEQCVANIGAATEMSSPAVSHHLRCLKDAGLICGRREGKEVYYTLADTKEANLLHHFVDVILKTSCPGEMHDGGAGH
ncbi:MAG: winged helix-turn-helix transcriptional regulator [Parasporobacterium sp.]|nr:winged helix-turn-helix transcriptional regulator [Parasporobacterium sp.]